VLKVFLTSPSVIFFALLLKNNSLKSLSELVDVVRPVPELELIVLVDKSDVEADKFCSAAKSLFLIGLDT
jgi:hypothetical protein